jgi:hypothetical protein
LTNLEVTFDDLRLARVAAHRDGDSTTVAWRVAEPEMILQRERRTADGGLEPLIAGVF